MKTMIGQPLDRVDGRDKVTGKARYAAEFRIDGLAHAAWVTSPVAAGRIEQLDLSTARAAPGVIAAIGSGDAPVLPYREREEPAPVDPEWGTPLRVFQDDKVRFAGQPVAVVVAETPQQARHAASLVKLRITPDQAHTVFDRAEPRPSHGKDDDDNPGVESRGDAEGALGTSPVTVECFSAIAREQQHPIEPHATIARWQDGKLTLWDKTQWVSNVRTEIAHVFGLEEEDIRVVSPFVGGAFGSALRTWPHVAVAALAAKVADRPVRLELERRSMFTATGFRPRSQQTVRLGAESDGRLMAISHDVVTQTSRYEDYTESLTEPARTTYACANVWTRERVVSLNTNTPCPMRAPGIVTGVHAMETAMDELAEKLGMDPVDLRRINHAERNEDDDLPWSSKELLACYDTGAERFGWSSRSPEPGSMRDGDQRIGYGMATSIYHAKRSSASVGAVLLANGTAVVRTATSDMGPGTYTSMTQVAADVLGLPPEAITFELGDTRYPQAPVHGGSITMASVGSAVRAACQGLAEKLMKAAREASSGAFAGLDADQVELREGYMTRSDGEARQRLADVLRDMGQDQIACEASAEPGEESENYASSAFGAIFAEVRVDPAVGRVRVARLVGAYDVGRVINPKIARSQCIGGMVGGLGMALFEQVEWDERLGRVMNANLAEYLVPVCADVGELDVTFVPSDDTIFNPLGAKGLAEVAICGVAPAIANAVYHAIGQRVRELPITPDRMLAMRS